MRDRFAYLPEKEFADLDLIRMSREVWESEDGAKPVTYLHSAVMENINEPTVLSVRVNGLEEAAEELRLYVKTADGSMAEFDGEWKLTDEEGVPVKEEEKLDPSQIYEIRVTAEDQNMYDQDPQSGSVKLSVALAE